MESVLRVQSLSGVHTSQVERCVVGPQLPNTNVPRCLEDSVVPTFSKIGVSYFKIGEFSKRLKPEKVMCGKTGEGMRGVVRTVVVSSATPSFSKFGTAPNCKSCIFPLCTTVTACIPSLLAVQTIWFEQKFFKDMTKTKMSQNRCH